MKKTSNPFTIHPPVGPYVHQVINSGYQPKWLTLSGQIGMTKEGDIPSEVSKQFELALKNIKSNLLMAEMDVKNLVKLTIYLVEEIDLEERTKALKEFLKEEETAMTLLYVKGLANPKLKVEIDVVACK
ncbi:RidA family protein [Vagococcus hydrophili]|uniref:RidA family protein n=1 Tax=Vagococcus hydrophili TaxID=2714947 RepID=A0A6G8AT83_9ENTE|nr:RidA family protein [Vagococcus hydrophili]QIL48145.1 RidA family protein [Vagococcus hydrophili]